jgi:hypothetical protein
LYLPIVDFHDLTAMIKTTCLYHCLFTCTLLSMQASSPWKPHCNVTVLQYKQILSYIGRKFPSFWTPHKCVMCSWHQFLWVSFEGLDPREQNRGCEALQVWIVVKANSCVCFTLHNVMAILSSFFFLAVIITSAGLGNSLVCTSLWIKLLVVTKKLNNYYTYTAIAIIHILCCLALLDLCHVSVMYNNGLL